MPPTTDCPLCQRRSARRACPALGRHICSVCCGTKREVEIDCPSDCVHLATGRNWEDAHSRPQRRPSAPRPPALQERHAPPLSALVQEIVEERTRAPSLNDAEVMAALAALGATLRTLESGLYYETVPDSLPAATLYRRLKGLLDKWMAPGGSAEGALRTSDAKVVIDFLVLAGETHGSERARSRRFLDWLGTLAAPGGGRSDSGGLIVP